MLAKIAFFILSLETILAFLPFQNPPWGTANYDMSSSTISMFCNSSGYLPVNVPASFGIPSIDWSNEKKDWALANPMDCEERLLSQAVAIKTVNPKSKVFLYRNLVKALPWFSTVRRKLEDPAYSSWFLHFSGKHNYHVPDCDTSYSPPLCSDLYHDQLQTPAVPSPTNPNPDGSCKDHCYTGGVPTGEYLFDWRSYNVSINGQTLIEWVLTEVIGGPTGVDSSDVDGFFIDDFWCSNLVNGTGSCTDPVQGPTEIDPNNQADMGLTDQDVADITLAWLQAMTEAQRFILNAGAYTWSLIPGQDNANAEPVIINQGNCARILEEACSTNNRWQTAPLMHGINMGNGNGTLPTIDADIASFLLMRGPFAFTGAGYWGMSWPTGQTWNSSNTPTPVPPQLLADYGEPLDGLCVKVSDTVFSRRYTNTTVTLDCSTYNATFVPMPLGL